MQEELLNHYQHQHQRGQQQDNHHQQQQYNHHHQQQPHRMFYSSTSTFRTNGNDPNTVGETVTTTTRYVNGKQKTIRERIVQKSDGTKERFVEETGDPDVPSLRWGGQQQSLMDEPRTSPNAQPQQHQQQETVSSNSNDDTKTRKKGWFW